MIRASPRLGASLSAEQDQRLLVPGRRTSLFGSRALPAHQAATSDPARRAGPDGVPRLDTNTEATRMAMNFEELDEATRRCMLQEFEIEIASQNPYFGRNLSAAGRAAFPEMMREAINRGNEETLGAALNRADLWNEMETYERNGVVRERRINVRQASERLALTEFNTWYVRGLSRRLIDEGVTHCQAYRAAQPKWEPADCTAHENQVFIVREIYDGHRARYWPVINENAVSIPFGPGCHHTIRRV